MGTDHFEMQSLKANAKVFAPKHEAPMVEKSRDKLERFIQLGKKTAWETITPYFCVRALRLTNLPKTSGFAVGDAVHTEYWEKFEIIYYVDPDFNAHKLA